MTSVNGPTLKLKDPLEILPGHMLTSCYSSNHRHPCVDELRPVNDNGTKPPEPDWITARIVSRPNGQCANYHQTKPTFTSYSRKNQCMVSGESPWERLNQTKLEICPEDEKYVLQGLTLILTTDKIPQESVYTFDGVVSRKEGARAFEMKASGSYYLEPVTAQLMANAEDVLARDEIGLDKLTANAMLAKPRLLDNLSFGYMHRLDAVPPEDIERVADVLINGPASYAKIKSILSGDHRIQKAKAFALLANRIITFDLEKELRDDTMIAASSKGVTRDIRSINRSFVR